MFVENFGWVGFVVTYFLHKINPNPRKKNAAGKAAQMPLSDLIFLGLGWPWVGRLHNTIQYPYMFSNPTEHVNSQTPYLSVGLLLKG